MKFNFRKIASVASSTLMMGSTVALAAAANFPAPFVQSGNANVAVVYGGSAASTDVAAATPIVTSLQAALAAQGGSSSSGSSGSSISGGDYVLLDKSSDKVNLGNSVATVFGSTIDDDDLSVLLADGTYLNDDNTEYDYEQKFTLGTLTLTHFADSNYNDEEPTVGFQVSSNTLLLNYTLDFTTDSESAVSSSGDLEDFETTDITILGRNYYILDAKNGAAAGNFGKFTLLDSANTAVATEGETQTVSVGSTNYEVSINFITTNAVKLEVNGQLTNSLAEGDTYKLTDGTYIGIKDILVQDYAGGIKKVEFSIGSGKLEIEAGNEIELNDDEVDGIIGTFVRGTASGATQRLDKLTISWMTDDEEFVAPGSELQMPGFEVAKFVMTEFVRPSEETTEVRYSGDDTIELVVPIKSGTATIPILHSNSATGNFTLIGSDTDERLATTSGSILYYNQSNAGTDFHNAFIATYNSSDDAESYYLSASVSENNGYNRTDVTNEVTGDKVCSDKIAGDTCTIGDVDLTITAVSKFSSGTKSVIFTAGSGVTFNSLYTAEGLKIYVPYETTQALSTAKGAINFTSNGTQIVGHDPTSFFLYFDEEDKDDTLAAGTSFNVTLNDDSDLDLQVSDIDTSETEHEIPGSSDDVVSMVVSDLATQVSRLVTGDRGKAEISYAGSESYAEVYLASPDATSGSSSGDGATEIGVVLVTDGEVSQVSSKNLIIIGGSCVNDVAAQLLGSTTPLCGSDFEATTGIGSGSFLIQTFASPFSSGKVATLVAGYNAADTTNAATYLRTQSVDTTVGKKYTGTSATSATLVTS